MEQKLVLFDMDGVVFDSEKIYFEANRLAGEKLGLTVSLEQYKKYLGAGNDTMIRTLKDEYGDSELVSEYMRLSKEMIYPLVREGKLKIKKGFHELISFLKANKVTCVLASSNTKEEISFFMENTGITNIFDNIICADDVEKTKPEPDIFLKGWKKAGEPLKKETLVLEDSLNGILAAKKANLPVIMVPDLLAPNFFAYQNTIAILDDLIEVKKYLSK